MKLEELVQGSHLSIFIIFDSFLAEQQIRKAENRRFHKKIAKFILFLAYIKHEKYHSGQFFLKSDKFH